MPKESCCVSASAFRRQALGQMVQSRPTLYQLAELSHLMSAISAECLTRPQYVVRSYRDAGKGRDPGNEVDMVGATIADPAASNTTGRLLSVKSKMNGSMLAVSL